MVKNIPTNEKLYSKSKLNRHVGVCRSGYENVHGGFYYGSRDTEESRFQI